MSNKIWNEIVEAVVRLQIEADRAQAKAKAEAMAVKAAADLVETLWDVELNKSTEEAVHDNMHPQLWS